MHEQHDPTGPHEPPPSLEPLQPLEPPPPLVSPTPVQSPRGRLPSDPRFRRLAVFSGAGLVLVAAAVAVAASPSPSPSSPSSPSPTTSTGASGVAPLGPGIGLRGDDHGFEGFRGPGRPMAGRPFGQITIAAINGSSLSLKTADGWTRTITVTSATSLTKGGQKITLSELKVGDAILFRETRNTDGTYAINAIEVVVPRVAGSVTGVSGNTFTLKGRDGTTWTVTVNGSTIYRLGPRAGSQSDVKAGVDAIVAGTQGSGSTLTALSVQVVLPRVAGQVTAKTSTTITIQAPNGTKTTLHVGSGTTYRVRGVTNPTLANVTVGMRLVAEGTRQADGSIDAVAIVAGSRFGPGFGPGGIGAPGFFGGPGQQG